MQLEDYFVFLADDDIRLKGTRVGIETILYDFIHRKRSPEQIEQSYRTVTLEQVYATILYYLYEGEASSKRLPYRLVRILSSNAGRTTTQPTASGCQTYEIKGRTGGSEKEK